MRPGVRPHHLDPGESTFAFEPQLDARKVRDLATLAFVGQKANACMTTGICRLKSEHVKTLFRDGSPRLTSFTHVMRVGASVRLQGSPVPGWVALPLTCGR